MVEHNQTALLITAARGGDRLALAKLLARCHPRLRASTEARMDAAMKARIDPDDVLQEVYLDASRQIDRFEDRGPGSFDNWLQTILNQKLINAWRVVHYQARDIDREVPLVARSGSSSYANLLDNVYAESGTPSRVVRREEALSAMLACINDLSEAHRQVIQLRFLEGLSTEEVATRLNKSTAAVVALSKRALEALRASMARLGEFTDGR